MKSEAGEPVAADRGQPLPDGAARLRAAVERQMEGESAADTAYAIPRVPDHVLLHRIGIGAYGEVWLARSALGTLRAVKIVYRVRFEDDHPFQREFDGILKYEPISRTHEGLVQVLHVGRNEDAGCFYYVMELADDAGAGRITPAVEHESDTQPSSPHLSSAAATPPFSSPARPAGVYRPRTLRSELGLRKRLPPRDAAQLALWLAEALAHLHEQGLVHRDIKPSNVIFVGGKPKLADIGLVTGVGDSRSFVGTEGFIPPEGPGKVRADIYALGKLLYELATGCDRMEFPRLPPELAQSPEGEALLELNEIITRACAPDPRHRYASARELKADLNLFLGGHSLRQAHKTEQHLAWLKVLTVAGCVLLGLAVSAIWFVKTQEGQARLRAEASREQARVESALRQRAEAAERQQSLLRQEAQQARAKAQAQELAARRKAYASDMNLLRKALTDDNLARAQELLDRQRPEPGQPDMRGWEWRYYWQFCQSDAAYALCQRSNSITSVSFSTDGTLLAVGTWADEVTVWDLASRQMIFRKGETPGRSARLAFAPTGSLLAFYDTTGARPTVVLWDARTQSEVRRLPLAHALRGLAFTRDNRLFTADHGTMNNLTVWDAPTGAVLHQFTGKLGGSEMGEVFSVTSDGTRLAHVVGNAFVRVLDVAGGLDWQVKVADELTTALAFSTDGQSLLTGAGYAEGDLKLWDVSARKLLGPLTGHRSWVSCLRLLSDGTTLASASADRTIRLWDLKTRQPLRTLRGQSGELWTMDAESDRRWLAGGCKDGSVLLWDLASSTNRPPAFRTVPVGRRVTWGFSPDGRWIATLLQRRLKLFDAATLQPADTPGVEQTNVLTLAFSPDTRLLAVADGEGHLTVWDIAGQHLVTNLVLHPHLADVFFSADGKRIWTLGSDYLVREWNIPTWTETRHWQIPTNADLVTLCSSSGLIATTLGSKSIELVPAGGTDNPRRFPTQDRICSIALTCDSRTLAAASENGTVEVWDTETLTRKALLHGVLLGYHSVAISPDRQRLAAGSNGQEAIKLWDLQSLEEVATVPGQGSFFANARFSPDGNTLGACNWNGTIHLWTAPSWSQIDAAEKARALLLAQP